MTDTKIYCRNGNIVVADLADAPHDIVQFLGRDVAVRRGVASPTGSGVLLLEDRLVTSETSHEVVVLASGVPDLVPGDRVIIYLGGDDGSVSANGISAFVKVDGVERGVIPERFVWARVRDGEVLPRGRVLLTERTARSELAFVRHTLGPDLAGYGITLADAMMTHGVRATGEASDQVLGSVTALFEEVARTGDRVRSDEYGRGELVCFSPSFMATRLTRALPGGERREYHLVDADEVFFALSDG